MLARTVAPSCPLARFVRFLPLLALAGVAAAALAPAAEGTAPQHDAFASAIALPASASSSTLGTTAGSALDAGEPRWYCESQVARSVWYTFEAPRGGRLDVRVSNPTPDPPGSPTRALRVAAFSGSSVGALTLLGCGGQGQFTGMRGFDVPFSIRVDAVPLVRIQVADLEPWKGGPFKLDVTFVPVPENDAFARAEGVPFASTVRVEGSSALATDEAGEMEPTWCGRSVRTVWYSWTPERAGRVDVTAKFASHFGMLAAYTGSDVSALSLVACGAGITYEYGDNGEVRKIKQDARLELDAVAGRPVRLQVGGSPEGAQEGPFTLDLRIRPPHDDRGGALLVPLEPATTAVLHNRGATTEAGETFGCGATAASVWLKLEPRLDGRVVLDTVGGTDFDTVLSIWEEMDFGFLEARACNDDAVLGTGSLLALPVRAGGRYYAQVASFGAEGEFTLDARFAPANDAFSDAIALAPEGGAIAGHNQLASLEAGEPTPCGLRKSVWYAWTPARSGSAIVETTAGTSFDTVVAAFTGPRADALALLACNDNAAAGTTLSSLRFPVTAGTTVRVAVGGFNGPDEGAFTLDARIAPANDAASDALALPADALSTTTTGTITGATEDPGEPRPCGMGSATVWYAWTPSLIGTGTIETLAGTGFDSAVAVYAGKVHASMLLACGADATSPLARAAFAVTKGTTYLVQVSGTGSATGAFTLRATLVPATAVTTATLSGTPGENGWWRSTVKLTLSCAAPAGDTCHATWVRANGFTNAYTAPMGFGTGSGVFEVEYWSVTASGAEPIRRLVIREDNEPPRLVARVTPQANAAGWRNADVTVEWICTDDASRVASVTAPQLVETEGQGQSRSGTCKDRAGNVATASVGGIAIDKTPPTAFADRHPLANAAGWASEPVRVSWGCGDSLSGNAIVPEDSLVGEGYGQSVAAACVDAAGNVAVAKVAGIHVDLTRPALRGSASPAANVHGWRSGDVTVAWTCADALSGAADPAPTVLAGEGSALGASASCSDAAGNVASARVDGIAIDRTPPEAAAVASPPPNSNGWRKEAVTVRWTCADALSGVLLAPGDALVSDEGAGQARRGDCVDHAGNAASAAVEGVHVDLTPPTATLAERTPATPFGWNNGPVTVAWTCEDALSGAIEEALRVVKRDEGDMQTASARCEDLAGHAIQARVDGIRIDATPPGIAGSRFPAANARGWSNAPVTVRFSCDDALAGVVDRVPDVVLDAESPSHTVRGECMDAAGNVAAALVADVRIDLTPPSLVATLATPPNARGWHARPAIVTFECHDLLSGVASAPGNATLAKEGANQRATGTCTDAAGNAATAALEGVHVDLTPPEPRVALAGAEGQHGWWRGDVHATITCSDALSGVVATRHAIDGEPGDGASANVTGDARHALDATCEDAAGHARTESVAVLIDATAPDGALLARVVALGAHEVAWNATDATSGIVRVVVIEHRDLALVGPGENACDDRMLPAAALSGACARDARLGLACYRLYVEDEAGNVRVTDTLAHPLDAPSGEALASCTIAAGAPAPALPGAPPAVTIARREAGPA